MRSVFLERPDAADARRYAAGWGSIRVWLPVMLMVTVIAVESTATFSSDNTSGWIRPWVERFTGHINDRLWYVIHHMVRKSGHFLGYGTLCLTWLRAWLLTLARRIDLTALMWRMRSCGLAIAGTFAIASLDEWHQTYLPSRTGLFSDVLLDTAGGTVMCCVVGSVWWVRSRLRRDYASV